MMKLNVLICTGFMIFALPGIGLCEPAIIGGGGFSLGEPFDPQRSEFQVQSAEDGIVYRVKPKSDNKHAEHVLLRITKTHLIHRITVFSTATSSAQCATEKDSLRKEFERTYPKLGYYAMDEAEMFYEDPRTYTIECVKSADNARLKTEYSDDALGGLEALR